jgi:hypothetical protein
MRTLSAVEIPAWLQDAGHNRVDPFPLHGSPQT